MENALKRRLQRDYCLSQIADQLARDGSILRFVGPEPALGVSRQDIRRSLDVGWLTSIRYGGKFLVIPKDSLES